MTINVQLLDQKCISYLMSINYFTHLIHCTALKHIITMNCCVFIYSYFNNGWGDTINLSHESVTAAFRTKPLSLFTDNYYWQATYSLMLTNCCIQTMWYFSLSFNTSHFKSSSSAMLKFILPSSHRLVRDVRSGNKIT